MTLALPLARHAAPSAVPGLVIASSVLLVGTAWHAVSYANTDIAWLLTVGEHIIDGAVPYRDIIETNPPGSVLLYLPAVLLGRACGIDPQMVAMLMTGLACAACLLFCGTLLRPVLPPAVQGPLLASAAAVLALLPTESFGQREHVILMAILPLLCRLSIRPAGDGRLLPCIPAGVLAGIGLAVKPYYALGLAGPVLLLWRRGGWRACRDAPDLWAAGATALLLLTAQLLLFPAFTREVMPLLVRVYLPARLSLTALLLLPCGTLALAALAAYGIVRRLGAPTSPAALALADTAALAAAGFIVSYVVQGKGWPYHAYPAIAAALLALSVLLAEQPRPDDAMRVWTCRAATLLLGVWGALWFDAHHDVDAEAPGLRAAVRALDPHPRVMSLADDMAIGHPLVRQVGGVWVGTLMSRWIDQYIGVLTHARDRAGPYGADLAFEARTMASDIRDRHPDAVLTSTPTWAKWIADEPEVAAALADYRPAGTYGDVTLWTRKSKG